MKSTGTFDGDFPGVYLLDQRDILIMNGKNQKAKDALWARAQAKAKEATK